MDDVIRPTVGLDTAAEVEALLADLAGRLRPLRAGNWRACLHFHLLGVGRFTLDAGPDGCRARRGLWGSPACVVLAPGEIFLWIYARDPLRRLLSAYQSRKLLATSREDIVMFAKAFDHVGASAARAARSAKAGFTPPDRAPRWRDALSPAGLLGLAPAAWQTASTLARERRRRVGDLVDGARDRWSYRTDAIAIETRDLRPYAWAVSTPAGLYAVSEKGFARIAPGVFYGITVRGRALYCFQANDDFLRPSRMGRILRLELRDGVIVDAAVVVKGLENGCHQIDFVGRRLLVCDTHHDAILEYDTNFDLVAKHFPLGDPLEAGAAPRQLTAAHLNCVVGHGGDIYVLRHNSTEWTGKPSEILRCDAELGLKEARPLRGGCCHNIVFLEDGEILFCLSEQAQVASERGVVASLEPRVFARGLSVDAQRLVVGGSELPHRSDRRRSAGKIYFYDRAGTLLSTIRVPGAPRDIRRLDGADLSLTNHRWPEPASGAAR